MWPYNRFAVYTAMWQDPSPCRDDLPILWAVIFQKKYRRIAVLHLYASTAEPFAVT